MGMFDKDKEFGNRLDQAYKLGEQFILHGADVPKGKTIKTTLGDTQVTVLQIEKMRRGRATGEKLECSTLASAITDKAKQAKATDFPCVVELRKVDSSYGTEALVVQWIRDYDSKSEPAPAKDEGEDDIPF